MRPGNLSKWWMGAAFAVLLLASACGGEVAPDATPTPSPTPQAGGGETPSLQMLLASPDLSVGPNRVAFGLIDAQLEPVRTAGVRVQTFYLGGGQQEGPIEEAPAVFRKWPVGAAGVYTVQLSFDRPGNWGLAAIVTGQDASMRAATMAIAVKEESDSPAIGSAPPSSNSKTVRDVKELEELSSDINPDPDLYQTSVADALDAGKPSLVTFSTPAFCQTATCGPQLEVVKRLKDKYKGQINVIHVEVYDNLTEIQGDLSRARLSPTMVEWNLRSDPFTFVMDREGVVSAKFEGFATGEEIEEALAEVLQ